MIAYLLAAAVLITFPVFGADPPLNCRYSLSPISAQHTADGGVYHMRLTTNHPQF